MRGSRDGYGRPIGTLHDDLSELACVVAASCARRQLTLWVDHQDVVYLDVPSLVMTAPPDWIVGTYGPPSEPSHIEADLSRMFQEHCTRKPASARPSSMLVEAKAALDLPLRIRRLTMKESLSAQITKA